MAVDPLDKWISEFPAGSGIPFHIKPAGLYAVTDLYDTYDPDVPNSWDTTYDHKAFEWDGGVDLGLTKNGQRYLVQCKHWRKRQVPVTVVRELNGVVSAQNAHGGFVVTGGEFTQEARHFANACGIKLIDGPALEDLIGGIPRKKSAADLGVAVAVEPSPACPQCGTAMIQRTAKKGRFEGEAFWGCKQYPKCKGILKIS